ncbi:Outer membrane lipoprotein RcsF [Pseudoalteromonas sp. P1-9]|nr:Outer membrane lipoprotein RcsF [Pseudoalteromonas sp. P1-9]
MRLFVIFSFITFLVSCSSASFKMSTNANEAILSSISRSAATNHVLDLSYQKLHQYNFVALGMIESIGCSTDYNNFLPSDSQMREQLAIETAQNGGNAMIFNHCRSATSYGDCKKAKVCKAESFRVEL